MKILLIDYKHPVVGYANRDQTGGFGSKMDTTGFIGKLIGKIKSNKVRVPVISLAYMNAIARNLSHECQISSEISSKADLIIIVSSMVHWQYEVEIGKKINK